MAWWCQHKFGSTLSEIREAMGLSTRCGLVTLIWRHRFGTTLVGLPGNYLNQCWQFIIEIRWHSPDSIFTSNELLFCIMSLNLYFWNHWYISQRPTVYVRDKYYWTFSFCCCLQHKCKFFGASVYSKKSEFVYTIPLQKWADKNPRVYLTYKYDTRIVIEDTIFQLSILGMSCRVENNDRLQI